MIGNTKSRNSENVICALHPAKKIGIIVFGFLDSRSTGAIGICDEAFILPSDGTGRIQESYITAGHALWNILKKVIFIYRTEC